MAGRALRRAPRAWGRRGGGGRMHCTGSEGGEDFDHSGWSGYLGRAEVGNGLGVSCSGTGYGGRMAVGWGAVGVVPSLPATTTTSTPPSDTH